VKYTLFLNNCTEELPNYLITIIELLNTFSTNVQWRLVVKMAGRAAKFHL